MTKYIVEEGSWQEACNGIACCECSMLDGDACRIGEYIQKQPIYVEAELDTTEDFAEWIPTDEMGYMGRCSECNYVTYEDISEEYNFCPNCEKPMRKDSESE